MRNVCVGKLSMLLLISLVALPTAAHAQSAIAGVVTDTTGGVLPGVTVEARSPALIEQVRTAVTDNQGQYRVIDLRPGTYSVTFTLPGFNTVQRDGIELPPNFTATVNVELRVGAVEETITVTGASPVVDVRTATRTLTVDRELLAALPTARNFQTAGLALPGLKAGGFDVGGSTQQQQGVIVAAGGSGNDQIMAVDGMDVMSTTGGAGPVVYHNVGGYQEMVFQSFGSSAEVGTPGVVMNMVPKTGGNQVTFEGLGLYANSAMEGTNHTPEQIRKGYRVPGKLAKDYDVNSSLGFPMMKDRIWWFTSVRYWTYDRYVGNIFYPDGRQAIDDNVNKAYTNRMTWQISNRNKLTLLYDKLPRTRYHSGIENGDRTPEATSRVVYDLGYIGQWKYTAVPSSKLLVEAGWSTSYYRAQNYLQSPDMYPSANNPYGAISRQDTTLGITWSAPASRSTPLHYAKPNYSASVSYVTGSHAFKAGLQWHYGIHRTYSSANGDLQQLYRQGVPYAVVVRNTPTLAVTNLKRDVGVYVQDSWTLGRLTLNPGLRVETMEEGFPAQDAPAGRFVGPRHFEPQSCVPCWEDVVARFGAAYDVFGDGRTSITGFVGRFMGRENYTLGDGINPMVNSTDQRTWTDRNGNDFAEESEIGPSTNRFFGVQTRFLDPDVKRPDQMLYSVGAQHELVAGLSGSVTYYHRRYNRLTATKNTLAPHAAYTPITIPDPRGNGQTLTVYNLQREYQGLVNRVDYTSETDFRTYDGIDVVFSGRLAGGINLVGGTSTGKFHRVSCEVENPNSLRHCDARQPFRTGVKLSGTAPLKYGLRFSGIFQSQPSSPFNRNALLDGDIIQNYIITRAVVPSLTLASVTQRLNEPGKDFLPRVNQLDLSVSRRFRVGQTYVLPQLEVFNALNVSPELSINQTYGPAYGRPLTVLPGRLFRVGVQVNF